MISNLGKEIQNDLEDLDIDAAEDELTRAILRLVEQTAKQNLILEKIASRMINMTCTIGRISEQLAQL